MIDSNTGTTSDHYLVYFDVPILLNSAESVHTETKDIREFKKMDIETFKEGLFCSQLNLSEFTSVDHAINVYENYYYYGEKAIAFTSSEEPGGIILLYERGFAALGT